MELVCKVHNKEAAQIFNSINTFKDANEKAVECIKTANEIAEKEKLERQRKEEEEQRIDYEYKRNLLILAIFGVAFLIFIIMIFS